MIAGYTAYRPAERIVAFAPHRDNRMKSDENSHEVLNIVNLDKFRTKKSGRTSINSLKMAMINGSGMHMCSTENAYILQNGGR